MKTCIIPLCILILLHLNGCASSSVSVPVDDRTAVADSPVVEQAESLPDENTSLSIITSASPQTDIEQASQQNQTIDQNGLEQPDPIVLAMINRAELRMADGQIDQAIASLERGARLKPKDPWLWHSLAVLRLQSQQWREAVSLAEKSISLSSNNQALLAGNWQVIVEAKKALGDIEGMKEAEQKLKQYRQPVLS